jgi:hypothetical protein
MMHAKVEGAYVIDVQPQEQERSLRIGVIRARKIGMFVICFFCRSQVEFTSFLFRFVFYLVIVRVNVNVLLLGLPLIGVLLAQGSADEESSR